MIVNFKFWNSHDVDNVMYYTGETFMQNIIFDALNLSYKYNITEIGDTIDGKFIASSSVSYKTFILTSVVPEYVVDALISMKLCDNIYIDEEKIGSVSFKFGNTLGGLINVSIELIMGVVIKSPLNIIRVARGYLKIDPSHNLLIGNGKKLIIQ